jgi:hypothetical protein
MALSTSQQQCIPLPPEKTPGCKYATPRKINIFYPLCGFKQAQVTAHGSRLLHVSLPNLIKTREIQ